jgi:hypothetical protein
VPGALTSLGVLGFVGATALRLRELAVEPPLIRGKRIESTQTENSGTTIFKLLVSKDEVLLVGRDARVEGQYDDEDGGQGGGSKVCR